MMPEAGAPAPPFSAPTFNAGEISLEALRGKWVVLYFYPRDNTPGCTRQACAFRDAEADFHKLNAVIVGCSGDSTASHQKFTEKHGLPFYLLSDADHAIAEAYGVWQEKKFYGKVSMGIVRTTFLIDPQGNIARVWPKVRVDGHIEKVLESLQELQQPQA